MPTLSQLLGIDRASTTQRRMRALVKADRKFLTRLVELRQEQGLTQQDVAERLGITQASVAAFERYDNDPKLSTLRRYAHAVGALVAHVVEPDVGQLDSGEWHGVTYHVPTNQRPASVTYAAAANAKRTDFAVAA